MAAWEKDYDEPGYAVGSCIPLAASPLDEIVTERNWGADETNRRIYGEPQRTVHKAQDQLRKLFILKLIQQLIQY